MKTRFAPSPTGLLHLGHAYAAMVAFDLARKHDGQFLLRFEDIDTTRVREEYYGAIEEDLLWLGLCWDGKVIRQVERLPVYMEALGRLKGMEVVYPCFCTRREIQEEIARMGNAPHGPEGILYPGICKKMGECERSERVAAGDVHCWRLDAEKALKLCGPLTFEDHFKGVLEVDLSCLGDVVLARKDIATSYHLAVVVDDAMQGITDVTRGEDLLFSTHVHRVLQALLGLPVPQYHHHRLIVDATGKRLAKRDNAMSVRGFRERGMTAEEVFALNAY
jgi:glutamyl-Q tRNA(Asp) synthetase